MDKELGIMKNGFYHNSINQLRDYNFGQMKKFDE
jgi:hypothetical protein